MYPQYMAYLFSNEQFNGPSFVAKFPTSLRLCYSLLLSYYILLIVLLVCLPGFWALLFTVHIPEINPEYLWRRFREQPFHDVKWVLTPLSKEVVEHLKWLFAMPGIEIGRIYKFFKDVRDEHTIERVNKLFSDDSENIKEDYILAKKGWNPFRRLFAERNFSFFYFSPDCGSFNQLYADRTYAFKLLVFLAYGFRRDKYIRNLFTTIFMMGYL